MLADEMSRTGYNGLFAPRCMPGRPDGVAIFFKQAKFEVEETKTCYVKEQAAQAFKHGEFPECSDVVVVLAALRHKISNSLLVIGENSEYNLTVNSGGVHEAFKTIRRFILAPHPPCKNRLQSPSESIPGKIPCHRWRTISPRRAYYVAGFIPHSLAPFSQTCN